MSFLCQINIQLMELGCRNPPPPSQEKGRINISQITNIFKFMFKKFGETSVTVTAPNGICNSFYFSRSTPLTDAFTFPSTARRWPSRSTRSWCFFDFILYMSTLTTINFSTYYSNFIVLITCKLSLCLLVFNQTSRSY